MSNIDTWKWECRCETEYQKMVIRDIVEICGPKGKRTCSIPELELLGHAKEELIPALLYFERGGLIGKCIPYPGTCIPFIFSLIVRL